MELHMDSICHRHSKVPERIRNSSKSRAARLQFRQISHAQGKGQETQQASEDDELSELERSSRRRGRDTRASSSKSASSTPPSEDLRGWADWKEGSLLPEGWDRMNNFQKAGELWSGKRGALFWANKISWAALFVIGGAWVLFRFVGPATGLYNLRNDLLSPPGL